MKYINPKEFGLYALRWQLSGFVLAPCIYFLGHVSATLAAIVGNFIGSVIFYFIDKYLIFKPSKDETKVQENA